jgi:hypothetical protein
MVVSSKVELNATAESEEVLMTTAQSGIGNEAAMQFESDERMDDASAWEDAEEALGTRIDESFLPDEIALQSTGTPPWRAAKSLLILREHINVRAPKRSKKSDGLIGDAAHCKGPGWTGKSDHCLNISDGKVRVVTAMDLTHDKANGCDCGSITEAIRQSRDSRVKYVIFDGRWFRSYDKGSVTAWTWTPYPGKNPHSGHLHISVLPDPQEYDRQDDWSI